MAIFDLSGAVQSLSNETVTFSRPTQAVQPDGSVSVTLADQDPVLCSVQPLAGKQAQATLELIQATAGLTVFTTADLQIATPGGSAGDRFTWNGDTYEIRMKHDWQSMGNYREYIAGRLN